MNRHAIKDGKGGLEQMIIVVDAYNILKLSHEVVGESKRRAFITNIRAYGKKKGHSMVVVFDGGPYQWPFSSVEKSVVVIYSGANETADDSIKKYLKNTSTGQALLISSDRQLCLWASDHGVSSVGSSDFMAIMSAVLGNKNGMRKRQQGELVKTTRESDTEVDDLMREASDMVRDKNEEIVTVHEKQSQKKLKKTDRNVLRILKKLQ